MDVESKTVHQDGEGKQNEDANIKASSNSETNGSLKDSPKHNTRPKKGQPRSRSRTPQSKTEDPKTLHVTLKKFDSELNGKEAQEEQETTGAQENDKVGNEEINKEPVNENGTNKKEESNNGKISDQKDEKLKKENKKTNSQEKKETTKKGESSKKESPKKDSQDKKEATKKNDSSKKGTPRKDKKDKGKAEAAGQSTEPELESVEMDPLVISDEPDPELQFDETSDKESGKGSPVISRCVTRRSQTRNIPTPKTPKSVDNDVDSEKNSATHTPTNEVDDMDLPKTDNTTNDTCESFDAANLSTRAEVGSDATRMNYMEHHNSDFEESSYVSASREKSLSETLRGLTARRSIRPLDDYRRRVLRSNLEKSDLNMPYASHNSVEQITTGVKRKGRSITPEDSKKFKAESPSINSLFSSPLANIRNRFKSDLPSSTPKLISYRDTRSQLHYNDDDFDHGDDEKKSWCSIM